MLIRRDMDSTRGGPIQMSIILVRVNPNIVYADRDEWSRPRCLFLVGKLLIRQEDSNFLFYKGNYGLENVFSEVIVNSAYLQNFLNLLFAPMFNLMRSNKVVLRP